MMRWAWAPLLAAGCWKTDLAELPAAEVVFSPATGAVPGWVTREIALPIDCPDGRPSRLIAIHPREPAEPVPVAVLFHSGSFDYVVSPNPTSPLDGPTYAAPSRLGLPWAARHAWATIGMYPSQVTGEAHTGAIATALAREGVASVAPLNCWGDWWHNSPGSAENDFLADRFSRSGRTAAEWAHRALVDPAFAEASGIDLPFEAQPDAIYAVGLGAGGRAIGELLHRVDAPFRAIAVDSLVEDLSTLGPAQPNAVEGLARIFPDGAFDIGALHTAPTLPPTLWVYSPVDTALPSGSQDAMLARLAEDPRHEVLTGTAARHVLSNADTIVAEQVVAFLLAAD